jgi:aldose 1-epimerase
MIDTVELARGALRLSLAPALGGSIVAFRSLTRTGTVDWMRPTDPAALRDGDVLGTACFPLVPYSNRIRDAAFRFGDHAVRLDHALPHALHGHGWLAPWTVEALAADRATLSFERAAGDWPWAYRAEQRLVLHEQRLDVTLSLRNLGSTPMPAGIGLHPYFPRTAGTVVTAAIDAMWETDAAILPTTRHRRRRRARPRHRLLPRQGARHPQRRGAREGLARRRQYRPQHHDHPLQLPLGRERRRSTSTR